MATTVVRIGEETARYSDNILNENFLFDYDLAWNIVSGGANGVVENTSNKSYTGEKSIGVTFTGVNPIIFNTGDDRLKTVIQKDGQYLFSYRCFVGTKDMLNSFNVRIYVNGILLAYNDFVAPNIGDYEGEWYCYGQVITLIKDDEIDFEFEIEGDTIGGKIYFDGFKLELNDRLIEFASTYSLPLKTVLETTEVIDVPSIASNSFEIVTATLVGAEVGDYVQITYPAELITLGLIVGYPIVTDVDEISFLIHNHSGGAINPASGSYSFKIVK